jgi:hypothetical protein
MSIPFNMILRILKDNCYSGFGVNKLMAFFIEGLQHLMMCFSMNSLSFSTHG